MTPDDKSTRDRLIDAAELLFADQGIEATSLRDVTAKAGANIASVNYYFQSKDGLVQAVYERRIAPLNEERLRLLDLAERAAADRPPSLEAIVESFVEPSIRFCASHPNFMRVAGRLQFEPNLEFRSRFIMQFQEIAKRYEAALRRALPDIPVEDLFWRMHFLIGAMIHTWSNACDVELVSRGKYRFSGDADMAKRLIDFAVAGMRAPVAKKKSTGGKG
ncbi:MAG: TetR family transcriptional regulator [Planctomycetes bacterium]|nr:TetR family transcriptional regulator [Planctomycetota bacterium]NUQ34364.1 TetR family transcriptional regulator [Planctomycetaceae bacterium]